jgi:O-antigen/teichoic acid export membrane protein
VRRYITHARTLATSGTAKDTYLLFAGNIISSFLAFVFTLIAARGLSVSDFGVFSAINNLVTIIGSVSDIGISAGLVKFIANYEAKGEPDKAKEVLKAALILRLFTLGIFIFGLLLLPNFVSHKLLASDDVSLVYWTAVLSFVIMIWSFFPSVFAAYKRFKAAVGMDLSLGATRVALLLLFLFIGIVTIRSVLLAFAIGGIVAGLLSLHLTGLDFLKKRPKIDLYKDLLKFSGWVGVNRVVSAFSGRLDVQMLAVMTGATITGHYSISARLALFIILVTSSFAAVLAPRLSSFEDKQKEKVYILKATLITIPIVLGTVFWIIIAEPFILILFGDKYLPSVPIFKALAASMIPFILTAPTVTAIIYAMKKPVYIGIFSIYQFVVILVANILLIPKIGAYGPIVALAIVNSSLAIFTWVIVIKHYWLQKVAQS